MPRIVREMLGNFGVSGEWSPCVLVLGDAVQKKPKVPSFEIGLG